MALRALMTKKKLDEKRKELEEIRNKKADFSVREADIEKAIEEAETDEERAVVEEEIAKFETEKAENEEAEKTLEGEVADLENELKGLEEEQEKEPEKEEEEPTKERTNKVIMNKRNLFADMDIMTRSAIFEDEQMKAWLAENRSAMAEKRAITNVGLTIPEIVLPLLRENTARYSKLYNRVNVRRVPGTSRQNILAEIPESIWTECCSNLNENSLVFNDYTLDCFKVGAFYAVCNASLSDSDYDLASEILIALAQGNGKALDKAILFGRNTDSNSKMPLGVASSIAQTSKPADYPATARAWVDIHSTNVVALSTATGVTLFQNIVKAKSKIANDYARGNITWLMNETTYTNIVAESMSVNGNGAVVAGLNGTMPVVGGDVEVLNFIPDNIIIAGYFDLYLLAERAGDQFATSEHVRFLQDQTVFKGTARYDGAPIIREAFMALTIGSGTEFDPTDVLFPQDTANPGQSV